MTGLPLPDAWGELLLAAGVCLPLAAAGAVLLWGKRVALLRWCPWSALPAVLLGLSDYRGAIAGDAFMTGLRLGLDGIGAAFLAVTSIVWLCAGVYAVGYIHERRQSFFFCFLLSMGGNLLSIVAQEAIHFYLGFALMSFASYGLVVHSGSAEARRAGLVYIVMVVAGELLVFSGLLLAVGAAGSTDMAAMARAIPGARAQGGILACLLLGFGIKTGMPLLHVWLPLAHPAAPTPASAVLSGCMIKAGLLGLMRFLPLGAVAMPGWGNAVAIGGAVAALLGLAAALAQSNIKALLAYSSIAKMGVMTIALGFALRFPQAWPALAAGIAGYVVYHGFTKGALFLAVGLPEAVSRGGRLAMRGGVVLLLLALSGAPLMAGALAKKVLKGALHASGAPGVEQAAGIVLALAAVLTATLALRYYRLWVEQVRAPVDGRHAVLGGWCAVTACVVLLPLGDALTGGAGRVAALAKPAAFAGAAWPLLVGVAIVAIAIRWNIRPRLRVPAGDVVVLYEDCARRLIALGRAYQPLSEHLRTLPLRVLELISAAGASLQKLRSAERAMTDWPLFGLMLLGIAVLLIGLGAIGCL